MTIHPTFYHDDASPVYSDFIKVPETISAWLQQEKLEKLFDTTKSDILKVGALVKDAKNIFTRVDVNLSRTTALCIFAAILATIVAIGIALCPPESTKLRRTFVYLSLSSASISLVSAFILYQMHSKVDHFRSIFE